MNSHKYLLLIDPKDEVLSLQTTALSCFYPGSVHALKTTNGAIDILKEHGVPEVIILDSDVMKSEGEEFYEFLVKSYPSLPVIVTTHSSDDSLLQKYPALTAVIEKPLSSNAFTYLIKSLTSTVTTTPEYIPVSPGIVLRMGIVPFDLYLKLSAKNFVKIVHKGEAFFEEDARKLDEKNIADLHIRYSESSSLLSFLESELSPEVGEKEEISIAIENLEEFEQVARVMNWSPALKISAQKTVTHAVRIISKNKKIISILRERLASPGSSYGRHIGLLSYLVCAVGSKLSLGEAGQIKLTLAALIHDVGVENHYYENIDEWNKRASNSSDKSPETLKYRMHPYEASKLVKTLDWVPPDVEQIILQHHETKDGRGFPRGLDSGRIGHLPALFIIVEDLVEFIVNGESLDTSITDFITWGRVYYDSGHFKKIFAAFEETIQI